MAKALTIEFNEIGNVLFERSRRSKHLNIMIRPFKGVRVSVPYGFSFQNAEQIVHSKIKWIKKHLARMHKYELEYTEAQNSIEKIPAEAARGKILSRIKIIAKRYGFNYNKVSVKKLKTQWGSCTSTNNISLNINLANIPEILMDYVIVHELVHTLIKSHYKEFWDMMDTFFLNSKFLDLQLRKYRVLF